MGKVIRVKLDNQEYVIEFNRKTLLLAADLDKKEYQNNYEKIVALIHCAFLKNHPQITLDEVEKIVEEIDDLESFVEAITKVMENSVDTLKAKKGNARWEVN